MEMMTGGELFDRIIDKSKYTENEARVVVVDLLDALKYCHAMGIVHRDIKPENLLYENEKPDAKIKIADFGLAKLLSEESMLMHTACGTPGYVAPEILKGLAYDSEVDLWSIGIVLYILLCGFPPFYNENTVKLYECIKKGSFEYPSPFWDNVSEDAKDLINRLLVVDPKKRLTAIDALNHNWITGKSDNTIKIQDEMKVYVNSRKSHVYINNINRKKH